MKICIATSGTRGDVQPYIALALELISRGHEVTISTEARMEPLVKQYGHNIGYAKISGDPQGMVYEQKYQKMLAEGKIMPVLKASEEFSRPHAEQALRDYLAAAEGCDLIITAALCITQTLCVAQKLQVPWVPVLLGPVQPTAEFPSWALSATPFRFKWVNRFSYTFLFWALWQAEKGRVNAWRQSDLGLPPLKHAPYYAMETSGEIPVVMMCSKHIIPGQRIPADWPATAHLTGPAFVPDTPGEDAVDPNLREFMAAGDKPVYLGFGSMPAPYPKALLEMAIQVVKLTGRRAVLCAGWSELDALIGPGPEQLQLPAELLVVPAAPHDWLLPRCCVAVHHCGVGTCNAVLRAGLPSVPCPVMLDQPVMALRLKEAGVATAAIPFAKLTAKVLADHILAACGDAAMQQKAAAAAASIAGDYPGVKGAADVVLSAPNPWPKLTGKL